MGELVTPSADYVVVGGGTAGCALAARLSEDSSKTVCLVEAGGMDSHPYIKIPAMTAAAIATKRLNWRFATVPQPNLHNRQIPVPRGRVLGGSGSINGMVYFRGHRDDFDEWARAGATGWSFREVLPYFVRSERNRNFPDSVYHSSRGPLGVTGFKSPNPLNFAFMQSLDALGFPPCADFNSGDSEGYGLRQIVTRDGTRDSTARSFLRPALGRANLRLLTDAQVTRLVLEGRRIVGIEYSKNGESHRLNAACEVILTAGALQSPQLLLLSGIGDGEALQKLGIEVRHHLPQVGKNLHDHLASPVFMTTGQPDSYGVSWKALPRNIYSVLQFALFREGQFTSNLFESTAFIRTAEGLGKPDIQLVFQPSRRVKPPIPFPIGHGYAISPVNLYPKSRGQLTLASSDPFAPPLIDPQLLADPSDIDPLIRAIKLIRRIFAQPPFAKYRAEEMAPGKQVNDDAEIAEYIRATSYTVHHPGGTCRMGSDPGAVVDPSLRVNGLAGLRVADGSVFPSVVGGNTNAAALMVGERAADFILGKAALEPAQEPGDSASGGRIAIARFGFSGHK